MELHVRYQLFYRVHDLDSVVNNVLNLDCTGICQNNFLINERGE